MTTAQNERLQKLKARTLVALAKGFGHAPKNAASAVTFLAGLDEVKLESALGMGERAELEAALDPAPETGLESPEPEGAATLTTPEPPAAPVAPAKGWIKVLSPAKYHETIWYNSKPYEVRANVVAELPRDVAGHVAEYLSSVGVPFDCGGF